MDLQSNGIPTGRQKMLLLLVKNE